LLGWNFRQAAARKEGSLAATQLRVNMRIIPKYRWRTSRDSWLYLVPARRQRPTGQFHVRPNSLGGVRWDCGGGGNWAVASGEETHAEGLGWVTLNIGAGFRKSGVSDEH
jgi:hypothetical protein